MIDKKTLIAFSGFAAGFVYLFMAAYTASAGGKLVEILIGLGSIVTAHWELSSSED